MSLELLQSGLQHRLLIDGRYPTDTWLPVPLVFGLNRKQTLNIKQLYEVSSSGAQNMCET